MEQQLKSAILEEVQRLLETLPTDSNPNVNAYVTICTNTFETDNSETWKQDCLHSFLCKLTTGQIVVDDSTHRESIRDDGGESNITTTTIIPVY